MRTAALAAAPNVTLAAAAAAADTGSTASASWYFTAWVAQHLPHAHSKTSASLSGKSGEDGDEEEDASGNGWREFRKGMSLSFLFAGRGG